MALKLALREDIEINPDTKKQRDIYSIYAVKIGGEWNNIPEEVDLLDATEKERVWI